VVAGCWIVTIGDGPGRPSWKVLVAAYVGVPFFGACAIFAIIRLVRRRPAVEADANGITDRASAIGVGHLSWDEVDHIVVRGLRRQVFLGIVPRDVEGFLKRQPAVRRLLLRLNLAMGFPPVNIPQAGLPMRVAALADLLHERFGVRIGSRD
jgi:hypothetical protein